jgi:hypothetical protein
MFTSESKIIESIRFLYSITALLKNIVAATQLSRKLIDKKMPTAMMSKLVNGRR